jgi:pimeloyl-ACP methyl ester carboxylesterase
MLSRVATLGVVAVGLALLLGIMGYVLGSFLLMRDHVTPRSLLQSVREAMREIVWAALTQPLLPLFYLVGTRMTRGTGTPIVVIHGYSQNRVDFLGIARACAHGGVGPVYGFNYPWWASVRGNARRLARFVERVQRETGAEHVDLVAHSLGGLVADEYLATGGARVVRKLVTIASPHAGVPWKGPIPGRSGKHLRAGSPLVLERFSRPVPVPCLSVYSTHDNVVHPPRTCELAHRGGRDVAVDHVGHLSILFDRRVVGATVDFLRAA